MKLSSHLTKLQHFNSNSNSDLIIRKKNNLSDLLAIILSFSAKSGKHSVTIVIHAVLKLWGKKPPQTHPFVMMQKNFIYNTHNFNLNVVF